MMLVERIKADNLAARKARNIETSTLLTTLYAEVVKIGKDAGNRETTDEETVVVVKKFIKGIDETLHYKGAPDATLQHEKEILVEYLPVQLSDDELEEIIRDLVLTMNADSVKQMGSVMSALKSEYNGEYDGMTASKLVKSYLV